MNNNKGMAFVSVVIAILFIGLLATSLSYMAYSNYQTKSTRWASENNFYYDELALNELTSVMRQNALELGETEYLLDPTTKDKLTCFYHNLGTITGSGDPGDYKSSWDSTWDEGLMEALLTSTDIPSYLEIDVNMSSRGPNRYFRDRKKVTFYNVEIVVTDKRDDKNYTTTITTDIVIPGKTVSASIPVNDFSLMTDNAFIWDRGGVVQVSGNFFCIDNPNTSTHNGVALQLDNGTQMHLDGNKSLIVGDVIVKDSVLYLNNEVTITGKIRTTGTGRVVIGGNAVYIAEIDAMGTGNIVGSQHVMPELRTNANSVFNGTGLYGKGLAAAIMDNVAIVNGFDATNNVPTSYRYLTAYNDTGDTATNHGIGNRATNKVEQASADATSKIYFYGTTTDALSGATQYDNSLIFLPNETNVRGQILGSTIIAPNGNKVDHSADALQAPNWSKLAATKYRACLNTMVSGINLSGVKDPEYMTKATYDGIIAHWKTINTDPDALKSYGYYVEEMNGSANLGNGDRYIVYNKTSGAPVFPWGYFIREDADTIIGDAFKQIREKNDEGGEYKIVYQNWVKE